MPKSTFERVQYVFAAGLMIPEEEITRDTTFADMAMDSLDQADMEISLEQQFGMEIPIRVPRLLEGIRTVGETVDRIDELMQLKIEMPG